MVCAGNSKVFRTHFLAEAKKLFVMPAHTFDNVKGQFPIGFCIWDTKVKQRIDRIDAHVFNLNGEETGKKSFYSYDNEGRRINDFLNHYKARENSFISVLVGDAPDFQNNNFVTIQNIKGDRHGKYFLTNVSNLIITSVYFAVRHCIKSTWLNDRDQFLYPNDNWKADTEFQNDCLAFTLFHGQNRIRSKEGVNHWIPFTEYEVNSREKFASSFMSKFINGKLKIEKQVDLINNATTETSEKLEFSLEAKAVFDAGRELWKYYHKQPNGNANASLYDIREHFQGRNQAGKNEPYKRGRYLQQTDS